MDPCRTKSRERGLRGGASGRGSPGFVDRDPPDGTGGRDPVPEPVTVATGREVQISSRSSSRRVSNRPRKYLGYVVRLDRGPRSQSCLGRGSSARALTVADRSSGLDPGPGSWCRRPPRDSGTSSGGLSVVSGCRRPPLGRCGPTGYDGRRSRYFRRSSSGPDFLTGVQSKKSRIKKMEK